MELRGRVALNKNLLEASTSTELPLTFSGMLSYSKSALVGIVLENIAYGLYLSYFLQCLQIIMGRKNIRGRVSVQLLVTTLVLFFLITMRMVLDNKGVVEAFTNDPTTPNAADIYLESFGNGAMFRTGTYIALTIVADIFIVFRVYAVWGGSLVAATVPFLLAVADIVTGALLIRAIRELAAGSSPDGKNVATHAVVFYAFTLSLNVLCTFLISLRMYLTKRRTDGIIVSTLNLSTAMAIVVESAALYSACLIAMIVPTALGNNIQYCLLSVMPGIVGIAFSLIIVRIGSGLSPHSTPAPMSALRFTGRRNGTQFDTTDIGTSRVSQSGGQDDGIQVHLSDVSHSNGVPSNSDQERVTQDDEKEKV
ncbi:hypothetical protein B0H10DRAFT_1985795 [Mycena sp. CBHHK59/15]|nr:hypothetical protein B0H10DRAFT_1985795 [Mycena sp. CBHHK59/15]